MGPIEIGLFFVVLVVCIEIFHSWLLVTMLVAFSIIRGFWSGFFAKLLGKAILDKQKTEIGEQYCVVWRGHGAEGGPHIALYPPVLVLPSQYIEFGPDTLENCKTYLKDN